MPPGKKKITEEEQKPLFFDSIQVQNLHVSTSLPPVKITNTAANKKTGNLTLSLILENNNKLFNIFLLINGEKKDLLYQVSPGKYKFTFRPVNTENYIEVFYTYGRSKSPSVFSFYQKG
jgi:hypothetical protein